MLVRLSFCLQSNQRRSSLVGESKSCSSSYSRFHNSSFSLSCQVFSVVDYGLGLTTMAQTNLLKMDRVQNDGQSAERGNVSYTRNHRGHRHRDHAVHARPPTNANQTESGTGQSIAQCRQKSPHPTPRSREKHEGMQTRTGQVLDGSSRGLSTARMLAGRAQANQELGKVPKRNPASLRDTSTLTRKLGKALSRMARRQNGPRSS